MPKAILEFNLPEEKTEFKDAVNGTTYLLILQKLDDHMRSEIKYNNDISEEKEKTLNDLRDKMNEIALGYDIAIWE